MNLLFFLILFFLELFSLVCPSYTIDSINFMHKYLTQILAKLAERISHNQIERATIALVLFSLYFVLLFYFTVALQ